MGTLWGSGHPGREETILSHFPFPCAILHHTVLRLCFYQRDNDTQPPGSPSQTCRAGIELAGLQGEASRKFPCSGRWHEGRLFSAARAAPTAPSSLARHQKPSSPCNGAAPMVGCPPVLPKRCRHPDLTAGTVLTLPCPNGPVQDSWQRCSLSRSPRSHPMAQGLVLGVLAVTRCPRCVLGFPLQSGSSPRRLEGTWWVSAK